MVYSICRTIIYRYSAVVYTCNRVVSYSHSAEILYSFRYIHVVSMGVYYIFVQHVKKRNTWKEISYPNNELKEEV